MLYWTMKRVQESSLLELQVVVTGMHLSPEFGLTYKQIEADGFPIHKKVEMLLSADTPGSISRSTGLGIIGMASALEDLQPDMLVVLGDRFEILSAVIAAGFACIPVAHLHGGEATFGAIDESIRHSITKMSHVHFTATEDYRKRVIQLGEHPEFVYNVGAPGIENILSLDLMDRTELEQDPGIIFQKKNVLVTFHPVTLEQNSASLQMESLLAALDKIQDTGIIFTLPNADAGGRVIIEKINDWVKQNENRAAAFSSLGQLRYLSLLAQVDAVVGNSSSGLIEVPAFGIGTVNIGDRQAGRIRGETVIDCIPETAAIVEAIKRAVSDKFKTKIKHASSPYGKGKASLEVIKVLESIQLNNIIKKNFYDLPDVMHT